MFVQTAQKDDRLHADSVTKTLSVQAAMGINTALPAPAVKQVYAC